MRSFDYLRVDGIAQALEALSVPGSRALAGGTTLVDLMKLGVEQPARLVDIGGLPLATIARDGEALVIGALASNSAVAGDPMVLRHAPGIAQAILSGASGQIRNMASLAGNLMQRTRCPYFRAADWPCDKREPGSGCAAVSGSTAHHAVLGVGAPCLAVNPSDLAVALLALDAEVHVIGPAGPRRIAMARFYRLPADTPAIETDVAPGELITHVAVPVSDLAGRSVYLKLRGRASYEFASASVAVAIRLDDGVVGAVAVALGGLGTVPWRDVAAEAELVGRPLSRAAVDRFCDALLAPAQPRADNRYKLDLARGAIRRCLLPDMMEGAA